MLILRLGAPTARASTEPFSYARMGQVGLHVLGEAEAGKGEVISPVLESWSHVGDKRS